MPKKCIIALFVRWLKTNYIHIIPINFKPWPIVLCIIFLGDCAFNVPSKNGFEWKWIMNSFWFCFIKFILLIHIIIFGSFFLRFYSKWKERKRISQMRTWRLFVALLFRSINIIMHYTIASENPKTMQTNTFKRNLAILDDDTGRAQRENA